MRVYHSDRLQIGIDNRRSHEFHASLFQIRRDPV